MENAVDHRAFHKGDHASANHCLCINAGVFHASHIIKVKTRDAFHHQHTARHKSGVGSWNDVALLSQVMQHCSDIKHVGCFQTKVKFFNNGFGKKFNKSWGIRQRRNRDTTDKVWGDPCHDCEVLAHQARHSRSLYFDDDIFTCEQTCRVDLGDGCCG